MQIFQKISKNEDFRVKGQIIYNIALNFINLYLNMIQRIKSPDSQLNVRLGFDQFFFEEQVDHANLHGPDAEELNKHR